MKPLEISAARTMCLALQDEIRESQESRYDHRLLGVLLVAQGMSGPDPGRLLGVSPRSVHDWVHRFEAKGFAGLAEGERSGRASRLSGQQLTQIAAVLREPASRSRHNGQRQIPRQAPSGLARRSVRSLRTRLPAAI